MCREQTERQTSQQGADFLQTLLVKGFAGQCVRADEVEVARELLQLCLVAGVCNAGIRTRGVVEQKDTHTYTSAAPAATNRRAVAAPTCGRQVHGQERPAPVPRAASTTWPPQCKDAGGRRCKTCTGRQVFWHGGARGLVLFHADPITKSPTSRSPVLRQSHSHRPHLANDGPFARVLSRQAVKQPQHAHGILACKAIHAGRGGGSAASVRPGVWGGG